MLKIAHITDTHISEEDQFPDGIENRDRFLRTLEDIRSQDVDLIIHTGDVCYPQGCKSIYTWLREILESTEIPYILTPGNHDNVFMMQEVFNLKDLPAKVITTGAVAMKGQSLLFLDSSSERLTMKQILWLKREIEIQDDQLFLFQHHPPCSCGVRVMDTKYPYKTPELFQKTIRDTGRSLILFCGHYHIEKEIRLGSPPLTVYVTPPTLGSLDPAAEDYVIKDHHPGWRDISIEKQKLIHTGCHYLP
ncbi:metallophosphoesterase [Oceanispirochaeta sp.]|jgi:Icc protein|uniref:metallophosphoesterase family protein n=1 Tax=Oceanispirochaeta sp. TaxID=2035350 RepID=UPI0026197485|nr:metallophosphoesterase [Oceanispirochaeta sp.]MDA3956043.1 metallophosphoesterase [Oceanispirochaeta sp.]